MNQTVVLREELMEEYWARVRAKEELQKQFKFAGEVLVILQADDPEGWQDWFDARITDETTLEEAVELMRARIVAVAGEKHRAQMEKWIRHLKPSFFRIAN